MKRVIVIDTNVNLSALQSSGGKAFELVSKMGSLSLRIPDSYHTAVKEIATQDNISINQFIVSAVAEKIAAYETQNYIESRADRASREKFLHILSKVPDAEPLDLDR